MSQTTGNYHAGIAEEAMLKISPITDLSVDQMIAAAQVHATLALWSETKRTANITAGRALDLEIGR